MILQHFEHDVFLLMVNLSQLKNVDLIINTFIEAINSSQDKISVIYHKNIEEIKLINILELRTFHYKFGWIEYVIHDRNIPEELIPILTNAIQMLGVILENNKQRELLLNDNLRLEDIVKSRTLEILKTQKDLQESQKKYKHLFDFMLQGIIYQDISGRIMEANRAAEKILGLTIDQMQGRTSIDPRWKSIHEDSSEYKGIDHPAMLALTTGREIKDAIMGVYNPTENKYQWISIDAIPRFDENNKPCGVFTNFNDITEKRETEAAFRRSEERFKIVFKESRLGIGISRNAILLMVNTAYANIFGYNNPEELIGENLFNHLAPETRESLVKRNINREAGNPEINKYESFGLRPDGTIFPFYVEVNQIILDDGPATLAFITDITERKKMENRLKESEERFRQIVENAPDAIFIRTDEIFVYLNFRAQLLFEIESPNELLGKSIFEIIHPDYHEIARERMKFLLLTKKSVTFIEQKFLTKKGKEVDVEVIAVPFIFENKESVLIFARDITERKKAESERLRLQNLEALGILAGGIAHDFNNILATIMGRISMIIEDFPEGDIKDNLQRVENATRRAVGLTKQLLTFAKGGAPEKNLVSLQKLIPDTVKFALSGSNVEVNYEYNDTLSVEADPNQIAQVIQNIIINAKQAMPNGGTIFISTQDIISSNEIRKVKIVIRDTGEGIPKENLHNIFNPYFTTKPKGTGLGLSVCHSIIRRHNGEIIVDSNPGKGTIFTIILPASANKIEKESSDSNLRTDKLNILIMDDEEEIRGLLSSMLKRLGHNVIISKNGQEAVEKYKELLNQNNPVDLVFLDLTIKGGMGGIETLRYLKEINPSIKAVVSSGYADSSTVDYIKYGFIAKLDKPYTKEQLKMVLSEALAVK
jgi:PAS domain S-box-containing protein